MLNEDRIQFQKEQDHYLKTMLDLRFFQPWQDPNRDDGSLNRDANLEIFITSMCNQSCEYCYLINQEGLYPKDCMDPNLLKKNLHILYDWILANDYHIPKCEFFTGEIWHSKLGLDILDITLQYLNKGMQIDWFMIASNCSFLLDEIQTCKIQHYIDAFNNIGHPLSFSISVEGAIIEDIRPLNNGNVRTNDYYERMFLFAKHNNFYFHPMVSAQSTSKWIENYKWWETKCKEWDLDINHLMLLEVRNSNWTDENIKDYQEFLKYLIDDYILKYCDGDYITFAKHLFRLRLTEDDYENVHMGGYIPWTFPETDSFIGCTCATDLTIRLGDLAICPCHRTSYNKYLYGKFIVENEQIVDIEANNPQMANKILLSNFNLSSFGCDTCTFNNFCLKGCYGAQYEDQGDPFIPSPNVCHFFTEKHNFLLNYYTELGIIDYLKTVNPQEQEYPRVQKFLTMYKNWTKKEGKEYVGSKNH